MPAAPAPAPVATAISNDPIDRIVAGLPVADSPRVTRTAEAETPPAPAAPPVNEESRVRAVLARYESAYSDLNATGAQAVWPGVDERSLTRAFESLESQRVTLGRCSVSLDGASARAECRGNVTYTPKVGGGVQTQARQWRFDLVNTNGNWQITRADAR